MKLLCGLRMTLIDLAHHPVVPPVHVDPNLDQPSSFVYPLKFSVHDHLQAELDSHLVPGAIAAQLLNEFIVYAQDQESGRPLANEQ